MVYVGMDLHKDSVMSRYRTRVQVVVTTAGLAWAAGCGDGATEPPPPALPRPTTITVTPATPELTALGATVQLRAEVRDENSQPVAGATVTWSSSASSVATVDAAGLVRGVAEGVATIMARAGEAEGTAMIKVDPKLELGGLEAYLTQAVQSREHPVPLVAGEEALLRVFVTAPRVTTVGVPPVRARFYLNGTVRHVVDIPPTTTPIPTEVVEGDLSSSANAEIPAEVVQPGLEMVIEIDGDRIPETGRMAVDVHEMPVFDLTVIPFLWSTDPDSSVVDAAEGMAADPEGHEMLWHTRQLLPIVALEVTAHEPVMSSSNNAFVLLDETQAIRALEGGDGHYLGMMTYPLTGAAGVADEPGRVSVSEPDPSLIAHELGHNLSLGHAPCGVDGDPSYPYPDGSTGAWGYDFRRGRGLVRPDYNDVMSYCAPYWISDYHFTKAYRFRLLDAGVPQPAPLVAEAESLLLWGGIDAEGEPFLNPTFVVDAPSVLPNSTGTHRITGWTPSGSALFSLSFAMPEVADGDGSSSFAFILPVQPGWATNLASIVLSGPGGSATLDGDTDLPMTVLLDPVNGQVRAILRDLPQADAAAALAPQAGPYSLDALFSRGIPDAAAWSR